jgi:microcystin-dependent protein
MDPYVGEIRLFSGSYAPRGWAFCQGQTMLVQENTVLFTVIGNTYGGDGKTTFALPNLSGRAPVHQGNGPGLTPRVIGSTDGSAEVTLNYSQMPAHMHSAQSAGTVNNTSPIGNVWGNVGSRGAKVYSTLLDVPLSAPAISAVGGNEAHNNMQPFLGVNFIIALEGVYPSKS